MRLIRLRPEFLKWIDDQRFRHRGVAREEADGIMFVCPKCLKDNRGSFVGTHSVICWAPHVPQTTPPRPGRWEILGTGFEDLTLRAGSSSVLLTSGCKAHFFIERGAIRMC